MALLTLYRHGLTAGTPPSVNNHQRALRGDCEGWTVKSTRGNTQFLRSVSEGSLDGYGYAVTLTLRHCPYSHEVWHSMRDTFIKRLARMGMVRLHWLTEWQRRGVPHLHSAVWFGNPVDPRSIVDAWLAVAKDYYPNSRSQNVVEITDSVGWFKYLAKHAVRGAGHYQRSNESIPPGWKKTGRMWGKSGTWKLEEPIRINLRPDGYYAFRRIVKGWRLAQAKADTTDSRKYRVRSAKNMLVTTDEHLGRVRGVSEWINHDLQEQILTYLAAAGYTVES